MLESYPDIYRILVGFERCHSTGHQFFLAGELLFLKDGEKLKSEKALTLHPPLVKGLKIRDMILAVIRKNAKKFSR